MGENNAAARTLSPLRASDSMQRAVSPYVPSARHNEKWANEATEQAASSLVTMSFLFFWGGVEQPYHNPWAPRSLDRSLLLTAGEALTANGKLLLVEGRAL